MSSADRNCSYCPNLFLNKGFEVPLPIRNSEKEIINLPYVWIASKSPKKVAECANSWSVITNTPGKYNVAIGGLVAFPDDILPSSPVEADHLEGSDIAEQKVLAYWKAFANFDRNSSCHRYRPCFKENLFVANDVNVWAGVPGHNFTESLRKPSGQGIKTKDQLTDFIVKKYMSMGKMDHVINRLEASVAMLSPLSQKWEDESQILIKSGVARTHIQLPWNMMTNHKFINGYIEYATENSGSFSNLLQSAGGIMTEYLVNKLIEAKQYVVVSMVPDSRYENRESELFLANARGFPPRLMWKVLQAMHGGGNCSTGEKIIMQPSGDGNDMFIMSKMSV